MIAFVDVNIFMYAAGAAHPWKMPTTQFLERIGRGELEVATDTEVLQELLYRYWHTRALHQGAALVDQVIGLIPSILPVETKDVALAKTLLTQHGYLEPRDAVHAAVMLNHGITRLYSYDHHFDSIAGLRRLEPPS